MANEQNLRKGKGTQFSCGEEAARNGRKGGIASAAAKRRKKSMQEAAKMLLDLPVQGTNVRKTLQSIGIDEDDATMRMSVLVAMFNEAAKGNVRAAEFLRDTAGENHERNRRYDLDKRREDRADDEFEFKKQKEAGISFETEDLDEVESGIYGK